MNRDICVIDDNESDLIIAQRLFKVYTPQTIIQCYSHSVRALIAVEQGDLSDSIIVVNIQMAFVSGWEILLALEKQKHPLPVYVSTASATYQSDKIRAEGIPMVKGIFGKPFTRDFVRKVALENGLKVMLTV